MAVDLAGRRVDTWGYGDAIPGRLIRATAGDVLEVRVEWLGGEADIAEEAESIARLRGCAAARVV